MSAAKGLQFLLRCGGGGGGVGAVGKAIGGGLDPGDRPLDPPDRVDGALVRHDGGNSMADPDGQSLPQG